jgi:hypothetical protein
VEVGSNDPLTASIMHVGGELELTPRLATLLASLIQAEEQGPQSEAGCQDRPKHCTASHWEDVGSAARPLLMHVARLTTVTSPPVVACTHCTVRVRKLKVVGLHWTLQVDHVDTCQDVSQAKAQ